MIESSNSRACFSQEGEDALLERILQHDIEYAGSFVDIGAHHPIKFSNTYKFYLAGWRGVNIEATPGSTKVFNEVRPLDINLEVPISDKEEEITFYMFNSPELNTFSEENVKEWDGKGTARVINTLKLKTSTINAVLNNHYPDGKRFDLLSIDVEGLDLSILRTLNFEKFHFNFIIVEDPTELLNLPFGEVYNFLATKGYKIVSKLYYSSIYYFDYSSSCGKKIIDKIGFSGKPETLNLSSWACRIIDSISEIKTLVSIKESFILVDQGHWGIGDFIAERKVIPFLESNGQYWGYPVDDITAIAEIERQRKNGATSIIFGWPAFWWLDYYSGFANHLRLNYRCILANKHLIGFDLKTNLK